MASSDAATVASSVDERRIPRGGGRRPRRIGPCLTSLGSPAPVAATTSESTSDPSPPSAALARTASTSISSACDGRREARSRAAQSEAPRRLLRPQPRRLAPAHPRSTGIATARRRPRVGEACACGGSCPGQSRSLVQRPRPPLRATLGSATPSDLTGHDGGARSPPCLGGPHAAGGEGRRVRLGRGGGGCNWR